MHATVAVVVSPFTGNIDILTGYAAEAAGYKQPGLLSRPMLSAVENHLGGPGRPSYFAGPTFPQLLPPVPQVQIPNGMPAMSAAEFVRPHPKTR